MISPEIKVACNNIIISKVSLEQAKKRLEEWPATSNPTLARLQLEKSYITSTLRSQTLTNEQRNHITMEKQLKERKIIELVDERKFLEKEITLKRKLVTERKKELQQKQASKKN
jgi:hypothetical protein